VNNPGFKAGRLRLTVWIPDLYGKYVFQPPNFRRGQAGADRYNDRVFYGIRLFLAGILSVIMKPLIIGLPKGSLQETTFALMRKAGFTFAVRARSYIPSCDDPSLEARLIRAQEISRYVELGLLDAGITGYDWIMENNSRVVEVADLLYAKQGLRKVRWVLAVPEDSPIRSVADLEGRRIATEAVGLTRRFLEEKGVQAEVEFSWGATEVKAPDLVDAIMELTETGSSLRANKLRILETVLESTPKLVANQAAWEVDWKRAKIEQIAMLLKGALLAETRVLLKMNARRGDLPAIVKVLPAMHAPTLNPLSTEGWVAVESVVIAGEVRDLMPHLKKAGAEGIIEIPLNKIIP
jgi:ATP phosphoribosyltransferase